MVFLYSGEPQSEEEKEEEVKPVEETEEDTTPRSAVIENIQNSGQEFLTMLVENVLKGSSAESKDFNIEMIPESNCAVVTFSNSKCKSWVLSTNTMHTYKILAFYKGLSVDHLLLFSVTYISFHRCRPFLCILSKKWNN